MPSIGWRRSGGVWLAWALTNAAGWVIAWNVGWPTALAAHAILGNDGADLLMVGLVAVLVAVARGQSGRRSSTPGSDRPSRTRIILAAAAIALPLSAIVIADWFSGGAGYPSLLAIVGALIGYVQWRYLKRRFALSRWWILATAVGSTTAWSAGQSIGASLGNRVSEGAGFVAMGAALGLLTSLLQRYLCGWPRPAGWWTAANMLGWAVAMPIGAAAILSWDAVTAGAVLGLVTALPLTSRAFAGASRSCGWQGMPPA